MGTELNILVAILVVLALLVVFVYPKMNPQYYNAKSGEWECTDTKSGDKILYSMTAKPINGSANGATTNGAATNGAAPAKTSISANNGASTDEENFTITPFLSESVEEATIYADAQNNLTSSALMGNRVGGYNPDRGDWNGPNWAGPEATGGYNDNLLSQCSLDPTIVRNHAEFVKDQKRFNQVAAKPDRGIEGLGNDTGVPVQGIGAMMRYNKERQVVITDPRQVPEVHRDTYLGGCGGFQFCY